MIMGIGTDLVEILRFTDWHLKPEKSLIRLFHPQEISYCIRDEKKSAARFAARFGAREALWKALSSYYPNHHMPFLTFCKNNWVSKEKEIPQMIIDVGFIKNHIPLPNNLIIHLSLSHEKNYAIAMIILENNDNNS